MARPLEIKIDADAGPAEREMKDFSSVLDDVSDDLQRMGDDGDEAAAELATSFKRMGDDARRAGKDIDDGVSRGLDDVKKEAGQSGREAAQSFTGEFDDIGDFIQETLANAFGGFGAVGAGLGIAAAIGVGVAIEQLELAKERVQELREAATESADSALDAGLGIEEFLTQTDEIISRLRKIQDQEVKWPWEDVAAGDLGQINTALDKLEDGGRDLADIYKLSGRELGDYIRKLYDERDALKAANTAGGRQRHDEAADGRREEIRAIETMIATLETEESARRNAAQTAKAQSDAGIDAMLAEQEAADQWASELESARDAVASETEDSYDRMRSAASDYATTEEGAFNIDRWLTYVEDQRAAVDTYNENLADMKLSPDQWENLLGLPEEARTAIVNSYATATTKDRQRIADGLADPGADGGSAAAVKFDENFKPDADVEITVDTTNADATIDKITADDTKTVKVKLDTTEANRQLSSLLRDKSVTIRALVDKSQWSYWNPPAKTGVVYVKRQEI